MAYNRAYHRFAVFLACATFLLIVAGALVTSNDAGLSVPDWPTSFGSLYRLPPMVGGVKYEHTHRMIAEFIGLLIIVLAVWTQRVEPRKWMKVLGWTALGAVIGQGVLGGITVLKLLPWSVSTAHATLGQTIFCLVVSMALFSSRTWMQEDASLAEPTLAVSTPNLAALAAACVWVQLVLGAAFRHYGIKLLPHLIGACVVTAVVCWTIVRVLTRYGGVPQLRKLGGLLLGALMVQLGLGFTAYLTRLGYNRYAEAPADTMVAATVAHVACGAFVLAIAVLLAIQTRRMIHSGASRDCAQPRSTDGNRMSSASQPLAIPRGGIAALARDYSVLIKARVTTLIVMTAWAGAYFAAAKSGVFAAFLDAAARAHRHLPGQRRYRSHQRSRGARPGRADAAHRRCVRW